MSKVKRILVPVDFSEAACEAARYADSLADHFGAQITLLHVVPPFHFGFSMAELPGPRHEYVEARNLSVRNALDHFADPLSKGTTREMREGDAAEEIIARAHEGRFDAILMPTRGRNALQRLLLMGSVTSKVLAVAECPVLTGVDLRLATQPLQFSSIVCAVDLGPVTERVLCWADRYASSFGAKLTVVHAAPGAGEVAADYFDETWRLTLVERLRARVHELLHSADKQADVVIEAGPPPRIVTAIAHRSQADLLVVGRGTSTGLLGRLRANAYEIIRQSQCPVVSV